MSCHENGELSLPCVSCFVHYRGLGRKTGNNGVPRYLLIGPEARALGISFLDQSMASNAAVPCFPTSTGLRKECCLMAD